MAGRGNGNSGVTEKASMSTPQTQSPLLPPVVGLEFIFEGKRVCSLPHVVLMKLLSKCPPSIENHDCYNALKHSSDLVVKDEAVNASHKDCIAFIHENVVWRDLSEYLSFPDYLTARLKRFWESNGQNQSGWEIRLTNGHYPTTIYKYMPYVHEYTEALLQKGKLHLGSPEGFNDPFDCCHDEKIRLAFIGTAMGCFSAINSSVLMFSHYANNHTGLCIGFDKDRLLASLCASNSPLRADLRPVHYLAKMPKLRLATHIAILATAKHDIWSYEQEHRLFMIDADDKPVPSASFEFDRSAISEVLFGCNASDATLAACRKFAKDLACPFRKAEKRDFTFGINYRHLPS